MANCQRCGKEHTQTYGSGKYCSKVCAYKRAKATTNVEMKSTIDVNDILEKITKMYPADQTESVSSSYVKFLLGDLTYRQLRKILMELHEVAQKAVLDPLADVALETSAVAAINAWYDVARYQTDPTDAALEWGVNEKMLRTMLTHRPAPSLPMDRHALTVPYAVKKARESFFESILSANVYQKILATVDDMVESTIPLGTLYRDVPEDIKDVPVKTMIVCQFQQADAERIRKTLAARVLKD